MLAAPRRGEGGASTVSSSQMLSPGGEPQLGRPRFSSPLTTVFVVAHEGRHPMNLLPPPMVALPTRETPAITTTLLTLAGKGYSRGMCPVSRFPWILKSVKLLRFSTHDGNSPDSRLFSSCSCVRLVRFPSSDGIGPLRLLLLRRRFVRLESCPSSDGIGPLRLLSESNSCVRLVRFPSWGGSVPFKFSV